MPPQHRLAQLIASVQFPCRQMKVNMYVSYDILFSAPLSFYEYLINPANEALVGTRLAYFPIGGPVPRQPRHNKALSSTRWYLLSPAYPTLLLTTC